MFPMSVISIITSEVKNDAQLKFLMTLLKDSTHLEGSFIIRRGIFQYRSINLYLQFYKNGQNFVRKFENE